MSILSRLVSETQRLSHSCILCAVRVRRRLMTVGAAPALPPYEENSWIELLRLFNEML